MQVAGHFNNTLGFCIVTYNRSEYLKIFLTSLVNQAKKFNLPIYISDNNSTDSTVSVIREFQLHYNHIFLNVNSQNEGFYRNLIKAMSMADTEYIWIMDDDDVVNEGAVELILDNLKRSPDFLVLNSSDCNSDMEVKNGKIISCEEDQYYQKGQHSKLLLDMKNNGYFGIMISMVMKRSIVGNILAEMGQPNYKYFGNLYLPTIMFYRSIVNREGFFLCHPMVLRRPNMRTEEYAKFEREESALKWFTGDRYIALNALVEYGYEENIVKHILKSSLINHIFNALIIKYAQKEKMVIIGELRNYRLMPLPEKIVYAIFDIAPTFLVINLRRILQVARKM